jgi:hypothetical protein
MRKVLISLLSKLLTEDFVEWIVNDAAELGIKIGNRAFFLYKGGSIEYLEEDDIIAYRPVYKREFGECVKPTNTTNTDWKNRVYIAGSGWKRLPNLKKRKN